LNKGDNIMSEHKPDVPHLEQQLTAVESTVMTQEAPFEQGAASVLPVIEEQSTSDQLKKRFLVYSGLLKTLRDGNLKLVGGLSEQELIHEIDMTLVRAGGFDEFGTGEDPTKEEPTGRAYKPVWEKGDQPPLKQPTDFERKLIRNIGLASVKANQEADKKLPSLRARTRKNSGMTVKQYQQLGQWYVSAHDHHTGNFSVLPVNEDNADEIFEHAFAYAPFNDKDAAELAPPYEGAGKELYGNVLINGITSWVIYGRNSEVKKLELVIKNSDNGVQVIAQLKEEDLQMALNNPLGFIEQKMDNGEQEVNKILGIDAKK
jgi:hypothetical protein